MIEDSHATERTSDDRNRLEQDFRALLDMQARCFEAARSLGERLGLAVPSLTSAEAVTVTSAAPAMVSAKEAARLFGVDARTIKRWLREPDSDFGIRTPNGVWRIDPAALRAWAARRGR